jgi:hypothetical protein
MALLHDATITPSKLDLLTAWLPSRAWFSGDAALERVAACRFDDPEGEVGLELMLVGNGAATFHVPLSYRAAALPGGDDHLLGTMEHSVLGTRWVYDACGDPVYAGALATTIRTGGGQAEEFFEVDGRRVYREPAMTVRGSGASGATLSVTSVATHDEGDLTVIVADGVELVVVRRIGTAVEAAETLLGSWPGSDGALLAALRS